MRVECQSLGKWCRAGGIRVCVIHVILGSGCAELDANTKCGCSATMLCLCHWLSLNGIANTQGAIALERRRSTVAFSESTAVSFGGNVQFSDRKVC